MKICKKQMFLGKRTGLLACSGAFVVGLLALPVSAQVDKKCPTVTAGAETIGVGAHANAGQAAIGRSSVGNVRMHAGALPCLTLRPDEPCASSSAVRWESYGFHNRDFDANWALPIPRRNLDGTSAFSEPRVSGISEIRISVAGVAIDPATAITDNVKVVGTDENGADVDLTGINMAVGLASGGRQVVIGFRPPLPDYATYTVFTAGLTNTCGAALVGDLQRCMSTLLGDVNNDLRVAANDVGGAASFVGVDPIDPNSQPFHARADANNDGRIAANDVGGIASQVGKDAREILCPR